MSGAKAAGLARATARGLPVLAGRIVPVDALASAVAAGTIALHRSLAAARLSIAGAQIDPALLQALRGACAGFRHGAIVRSSSPLERDPRWSGAFATYHEVGSGDLETALLGCAASLFSRDVVGRAEELGVAVTDLRVASLVQPWLPMDAGGTASTDRDGLVTVLGVRGDPAALVAGRAQGGRAIVTVDGFVESDISDGVGPRVAAGVARLARRVNEELGEGWIEWGLAKGRLWLLQVRQPAAVQPRPAQLDASTRPPTPMERRLAHLAQRFPGLMGELTVLPWGVALEVPPEAPPAIVSDPAATFHEILAIAAALRAAVWRTDAETAALRWSEAARGLLSDVLGGPAPQAFDRLRAPDPAVAGRLVASMRGLGEALAARGSLPHPGTVWRLSPQDLELAVHDTSHRPSIPQGADRWEPFVAAVVGADGIVSEGLAVSPGVGAGPAHPLMAGAGRPGPRAVLVAARPVPQIAPLLWGCAGLVTTEGSEGAHLFEVARSLGVPAVTSLRFGVPGAWAPGTLVAVDGDRGTVAVLEGSSMTDRLIPVGA